MKYDLVVVGGGIVGLATAFRFQARHAGFRVLLLEKENAVARHQSGHNSGVIHAGVYYAPGSLKARLCRTGARMIKDFCRENAIGFEERGKLIVATDEVERQRLHGLRERATANGIPFTEVPGEQLKAREPLIRGVEALFFPETAIVDYAAVAHRMAERFVAAGGEIQLGVCVDGIRETANGVTITSGAKTYEADRLVACAGAQSDRLARLAGLKTNFRIVPFRGEYYEVDPRLRSKINHLIYPVPDPDLPFLGIHLTHEVGDRLSVGPNAVLGFAREDLRRFSVNMRDCLDILTYGGFWRFLRGNLGSGLSEFRNSLFTSVYLRACRKYMPSLERRDLGRRKAGVRAQVIMDDGSVMHDFLVMRTGRMVHICNAPSPAATSSLAIAEHILENYLTDR